MSQINCARSVVSETTAASTYVANIYSKEPSMIKQDSSEDLEEDLWAYSRDSKQNNEEFVGEHAYKAYY